MQALNLKYQNPIRILATGFQHDLKRILCKKGAYNWLMSFSMQKLEKAIEPEGVIYLTDNAEEVLTEFNPEFDNKF